MKCKEFTQTIDGYTTETKNKRVIYKGICYKCGFKKNKLLPKSEGTLPSGKGVFNTMFNAVGKIMPEMHLKHVTGEHVPGGSFNDKDL
jgi:hypothetical protein